MDKKIFKADDSGTISPMHRWANRFRELFKQDPDVKVGFAEDTNTITLVVNNAVKALCIKKLVPEKKEFPEGTITVKVEDANRFGGEKYLPEVVYEAFRGNPLFHYMHWWSDSEHQTNPYCWVAMSKDPVFFPESDLHNIWGDAVELPEDIAMGILPEQTDHIFYCTDNPDREMPDENTVVFGG